MDHVTNPNSNKNFSPPTPLTKNPAISVGMQKISYDLLLVLVSFTNKWFKVRRWIFSSIVRAPDPTQRITQATEMNNVTLPYYFQLLILFFFYFTMENRGGIDP